MSEFLLMEQREYKITNREREVLSLIVEGMSDRQIAERMSLTLHTVNAYRKSLLKKLNANNVASLVRIAIQNEIIK